MFKEEVWLNKNMRFHRENNPLESAYNKKLYDFITNNSFTNVKLKLRPYQLDNFSYFRKTQAIKDEVLIYRLYISYQFI